MDNPPNTGRATWPCGIAFSGALLCAGLLSYGKAYPKSLLPFSSAHAAFSQSNSRLFPLPATAERRRKVDVELRGAWEHVPAGHRAFSSVLRSFAETWPGGPSIPGQLPWWPTVALSALPPLPTNHTSAERLQAVLHHYSVASGFIRWRPVGIPAAAPADSTWLPIDPKTPGSGNGTSSWSLPRHFSAAAARYCLSDPSQGIYMSGDSTTRELFEFLIRLVQDTGPTAETLYACDPMAGYGCYTCRRGCKHQWFKADTELHWQWMDRDVRVFSDGDREEFQSHARLASAPIPSPTPLRPLAPGAWLSYAWKPEFWSPEEDARLLAMVGAPGGRPYGANYSLVVASKGVHLAADAEEDGVPGPYEFSRVMEMSVAQGRAFGAAVARTFPRAHFLWRDSYWNNMDAKKEAFLAQLRDVTTPVFTEGEAAGGRNFTLLPGFAITYGASIEGIAPPSTDGTHQPEEVKSLLVDLILNHVCTLPTDYMDGFRGFPQVAPFPAAG